MKRRNRFNSVKLSVALATYNEENNIGRCLDAVKGWADEIVVVDDGSTDGTGKVLEKVKGENGIKVILKEKNEGKGKAIREGLKNVIGEVVIIQDADLEYEPLDWLKMLKLMEEKNAYIVYGSRILGKGGKSSLSFYLGGRFLSSLANLLYNSKITDEPTCYKMFRKEVINSVNLKCKGFEFCPEVTAKVRKKGYEIFEVPISYYPRSIKEGKKIRWKDGLIAIWTLIKYRFVD